MTHHPHTTWRGLTLVETVIVSALAAILIVILGLLIYLFGKVSTYDKTAALSSSSASALMHEVETLAGPADAVVASHAFSGTTYTTSSTTLVLEIPSIDSSGSVIANTYDYAAIYATGTTAYRILSPGSGSSRIAGTKQLSTTVNMLSFTYDNADATQVTTVTTDIQTRVVVKQDTLTDRRRETIILRNH